MRLLEPLARMSRRSADEYEALAGAGVAFVVEPSAACGPPRVSAGSFEDALGALLRWEPSRAQRAGVGYACALGLPPAEANEASVIDAVLWLLPRLLDKDGVVAVGEIGLDEGTRLEEDALSRQLELARRRGLPAVVRAPGHDVSRGVERALALIAESRIAPGLVLLTGLREASLPVALDAGCWAGVALGARGLEPAQAAAWHRRWGTQRLVLSGEPSCCGGELLAVPRAARALREGGVAEETVSALLWDNPARFYGQSGRLRPLAEPRAEALA